MLLLASSVNLPPCTVPNAPPEMFNASSIDPNSVNLEWSPPSPGMENGIILYYNVTLTEQETGATSQYTSVNNYIMISSLHPYYTYVVMVAAVTVVGSGPTNVLTIKMPEDGKQSLKRKLVAIYLFACVIPCSSFLSSN